MSCQRRVWRYENCGHEEEIDLTCSFAGDPDHDHNTVVVHTENPPACSICKPPAPPTEEQARNLNQNIPHRHLGAPWSSAVVFRGVDRAACPNPTTATRSGPAAAAVDGATVNGAAANQSTGHAPRRIDDNTPNLPWATIALHNQHGASAPPVQPPGGRGGGHRDTDNNERQEQSGTGGHLRSW